MGDSAWRAHYNSELRAEEIRAVIAAAQLGERPFVIGHSFGGFMTMKVASQYGDMLGGAVIVDSPIRYPKRRRGIRSRGRPWATSVSTRLSTLPWRASA